jgi:hypothetical protein
MASLKQATNAITGRLEDLVGQLRTEFDNGEMDFERLASIADQISEAADGLAETFSNVNDTLMQRLDQLKSAGSNSAASAAGSQKKTSSKAS